MYNNTCILLNSDGEIILSDPHLHGHNAAIKNCAEKIGIELDDTQPMPKMLEKLARVNIFSLLNAGYVVDEDGNKRKTGYMAVPSKFKNTQLDGLKILVSGFDQYKTITTWKLIDGSIITLHNRNPYDVINDTLEDTLHIDSNCKRKLM